ncbi:hypothetical protein WME99_13010 [Sorangium sp. So ce136]|uniref:hypothetical protein n=1 Tax=Sorangium sp. So ce136 TaxID=3133284 RepID=UPI003F01E581
MDLTNSAAEDALRGESLRLSGNYSEAIKFFSKAIQARQDHWWAYAHRAAARAALGNFAGAYSDFKVARPYYLANRHYPWLLGQKGELFRLWARATLMRAGDAQEELEDPYDDEDLEGAPLDPCSVDYMTAAARQSPGATGKVVKVFAQMEVAVRLFSKANALSKGNPWIVAHRGATRTMRYWIGEPSRRLQGGSEQDFLLAKDDFETAYALNPAYGWAYAFQAILIGLHGDLDEAMNLIGKAYMNGLSRQLPILRVMMELAAYKGHGTAKGDESTRGGAGPTGFETAVGHAWQTLQIDSEEAFARYFVANGLKHISERNDPDAEQAIVRARAELNGLRARLLAMEGGLDCLEGKYADARQKLRLLKSNFDLEALSLVRRDPAWKKVRDVDASQPQGRNKELSDTHTDYKELFAF